MSAPDAVRVRPPVPDSPARKELIASPHVFEEAHVMEVFDGTTTSGRKGIAYDWQSLLVSAEAATLDLELAAMTTEYAE
jgi:hypothetical protein